MLIAFFVGKHISNPRFMQGASYSLSYPFGRR